MSAHEVAPLFPLPNVVVFPGSQLPLHLFEPRYCAMMEDMLRAKRPAMVMVQALDADGRARTPLLAPVGCLGRVDGVHRRPDGTFHLMFSAAARVALTEVPAATPYRLASVVALPETEDVQAQTLHALTQCVLKVVSREAVKEDRVDFKLPADRLVDMISDRFIKHAPTRQTLLDEPIAQRRAEMLLSLFLELIVRQDHAASGSLN